MCTVRWPYSNPDVFQLYVFQLRVDWLPARLTPRRGLWGRGQLPPLCGSILGKGAELTGTAKISVGLGS